MNKENSDHDLEQQKALLLMNTTAYKLAMQDDLAQMSRKARRAGTTGILIGGALFLSYMVIKKVFAKKSSSTMPREGQLITRHPKNESFIVTLIKEQIALFIFAMARQTLAAYIKSKAKNSLNA